MNQLENINIAEYLDSSDSAETITNLLLQNSIPLEERTAKQIKRIKVLFRLPEEVKVVRYHGKVRDSKMRVLTQTTTFWPLLSRTNTVDEN